MSTKDIGKKIREARNELGISQKKLGEALIISEKAISSYESGRTAPSIQILQKIAKRTNKPITYFTDELTKETSLIFLLENIENQLKEIRRLLEESTNN